MSEQEITYFRALLANERALELEAVLPEVQAAHGSRAHAYEQHLLQLEASQALEGLRLLSLPPLPEHVISQAFLPAGSVPPVSGAMPGEPDIRTSAINGRSGVGTARTAE